MSSVEGHVLSYGGGALLPSLFAIFVPCKASIYEANWHLPRVLVWQVVPVAGLCCSLTCSLD